ncbi:MAG TPA: hypothetical protein VKW78_01560 [Terriglobales bacterium]|nr:hypothetical protein [Terriglobales bacterium]
MRRNLISISLAVFFGLPVGWVLCMAATPLLWRLEPVLHTELAGHSGPSDWVFYVFWAVVISALFFLFRLLFKSRQSVQSTPANPR